VGSGFLATLALTAIFLGFPIGSAFACQCSAQPPDVTDALADVVFLGNFRHIDRDIPYEEGTHVTFEVLESWKGVDTIFVTIHTGDGSACGYFPFGDGQDYSRQFLIFGTNEMGEIRVTQCGGTMPIDIGGLRVENYLQYLDANYEKITLKDGHFVSTNIAAPMPILGSLVALSVATFFIIRYRR
jgi:hypothetical protein